MNVLVFDVGGRIPNIAVMRIAAHHRALGDTIEIRNHVEHYLWDKPDLVYASIIFKQHRPLGENILKRYPYAILGGTGWDETITLGDHFIYTLEQDYDAYPGYQQSIGFTQRGCRLKCEFCVVPKKEGAVRPVATIRDIWRGDPWPKEILLLDNDFFGQPFWRDRIQELRDGGFKVSFNQGINARCLTDEAAEAIASVDYRDDSMKVKRIYTAWDNKDDETRLFAGLSRLVKYGVLPDHIMVYMLCGYWPGETGDDRDYRRARLREFGARPYPMPYTRTPELVGFQRFVTRAYDKNWTWAQFTAAGYRPERLGPKWHELEDGPGG